MNNKLDITLSIGYKSNSQIARVLTEGWVTQNSYCPSCGEKHLTQFNNNNPAGDFYCSRCAAEYELKSQKNKLTMRVLDGAYRTMIEKVRTQATPNFFLLNYSERELRVINFMVIPKHYFIEDVIERRKPLAATARRAYWVGCNILLGNVPSSGRIHIVKDGNIIKKEDVLKKWSRTAFLANQRKEERGWTIEVIKLLDSFQERNFSLQDIYQFENGLKKKFPNNNFIKEKLRQQLQVLRDKGIIEFTGRGSYRKL